MSAILTELVESLELLAADATAQTAYIRDKRVHVDELALNFDDVYRLLPSLKNDGKLNNYAIEALEALNRHLLSFSGQENGHLWTFAAFVSAQEWTKVRQLAHECLRAIGVS